MVNRRGFFTAMTGGLMGIKGCYTPRSEIGYAALCKKQMRLIARIETAKAYQAGLISANQARTMIPIDHGKRYG